MYRRMKTTKTRKLDSHRFPLIFKTVIEDGNQERFYVVESGWEAAQLLDFSRIESDSTRVRRKVKNRKKLMD